MAPRIAIFGVMSTRNPYMESSGLQCLLNVTASFLALVQMIYFYPKQAKYKSALWALLLIPVVPYVANMIAIRRAELSASSSFDGSPKHPVEALIEHAKADFSSLVEGQSQNYTAAHDEYRRRYSMSPPPGFEAWYNFAVQHESAIIDDFDVMYGSISPFWKLSGMEVRATMGKARDLPNIDLWNCHFLGETAETRCSHPSRTNDRHLTVSINNVLGGLRGLLPNLTFLVNHLDEPRVLVPAASQFVVTDMPQTPNWDAITKFCDARKSRESSPLDRGVELLNMSFVADARLAKDLCRHPEYRSMHGLLMSPTSFKLIEGSVPVLSTGTLSTMGDVLFPSPAYNESGFRYDESHDLEWEKKSNHLYWAGSTTGGFAEDDGWQHFQRQRFVALAQNLQGKQHQHLQTRDGVVHRVASPFLNRKAFDVSFTKIFQCARKPCRDESAYFHTTSWADKDKALQSRLVFDIDGNGISGRYYKLLASRSLPLKHTLLREWHDDRLVPWVHYVPVSQGMDELPELVLYLTSTKPGQRHAKDMADQGREWFSKALRDVDSSIYMYRLLLELARLQDPDREAV